MKLLRLSRKHRKKLAMQKRAGELLDMVELTICDRLASTMPGVEWRWYFKPDNFVLAGGIARIEVRLPGKTIRYADVCLRVRDGEICSLDIQMVNVSCLELTEVAADAEDDAGDVDNSEDNAVYASDDFFFTSDAPILPLPTSLKPTDEKSLGKWFNIVFMGTLERTITDLHAQDEYCLVIDDDGNASVLKDGAYIIVADFGEMPNRDLWDIIIDKIAETGDLFSETRGKGLFISWPAS